MLTHLTFFFRNDRTFARAASRGPGLEKAVPFAGHPMEEKCTDTVR